MREPDGVARRRPPERALIVVNPAAGIVTGDLVEQVAAGCREHLDRVSIVHTRAGRGAVDVTAQAVADARAAGEPVDAVLAVGGDATACEVAEGLARAAGSWRGDAGRERQPALLLIPGGRGNSAYRGIWGDASWHHVLRAALSGDGARVRHLDLLRIEDFDRASLLGLNAGLLARIVRLAADEPAAGTPLERYGRVIWPVLESYEPYRGRVTVDEACLADGMITQVTVGGLRRSAGGALEILPRSVLDDGLLDVCVVGELADRRLADVAPLLATGAHLDLPHVTYAQGRRVVLERDDGHPLELECDGDAWAGECRTVALETLSGAVPTFTAADAPAPGGLGLYALPGAPIGAGADMALSVMRDPA